MEHMSVFLRGELEFSTKKDKENFKKIQTTLRKHGVYLDLEDNKMSIFVFPDRLTRKAGRRRNLTSLNPGEKIENYKDIKLVSYADILEWQKTMSVDEIVSKLNMSKRTYYRRLKKMKEDIASQKEFKDRIF